MDWLIGGLVAPLLPFLWLGVMHDPQPGDVEDHLGRVCRSSVGFQLVGHHFEGKRPVLLDNLFQGMLGPTFLVYEVVHRLGLKQELKQNVDAELAPAQSTS